MYSQTIKQPCIQNKQKILERDTGNFVIIGPNKTVSK